MKLRSKAAVMSALLVGGSAIAVAASSPAQAASGRSYHGCPYGAVCIYPQNAGFNHDRPESGGVFYSYAGHNIYDQYGTHRIVNNQYGSAGFGLCAGTGGRGGYAHTGGVQGEWGTGVFWADVNLTPVNSVDVRPSSQWKSFCRR